MRIGVAIPSLRTSRYRAAAAFWREPIEQDYVVVYSAPLLIAVFAGLRDLHHKALFMKTFVH